jgi:flagellar basal-body rod protein FlgF/flagellar basal-body rod protein FlgG
VDSGFYAAANGMRAQMQALDLMANNLANVNTPGYLGGQATFHALLAGPSGQLQGPLNRVINNFNMLGGTSLELASGNLERTDNPLDLAIEGDGFFAVQTPAGTMYTRNGGFRVSPQRQLTSSDGDPVLGDQGPIRLPAGKVSISADGTISVDGAVSGKLRVVEFAPGATLEPQGRSLYSAPSSDARPSPSSAVRQGMIAASNVNPVTATVGLITVQRNADMLQRALSEFYSDFDRIAVEDLPHV